jgi:hypothetical protein
MKEGIVVRKITQTKIPFGDYLYVIKTFGRRNTIFVVASTDVRSVKENFHDTNEKIIKNAVFVAKNTVTEIPMAKLQIPSHIYQRVHEERTFAIIHSRTSAWVKLLKQKPELVQLRDFATGEIMIFKLSCVALMPRSRDIRLELGTRII